jgi:hypothetical protein
MNRAERRCARAVNRRENRLIAAGKYQTKRECGTCTLCCRLKGVASLNKPAREMCQHCTGTSCGIYDRRPLDCRQWMCGWKRDEDGHMFGDELRPDRCGFIIDPRKFRRGIPLLEIIVDDERGDVDWEALYRVANGYKEGGVLVVADGPDGDDLVFIDPSLEERAYAAYPECFPGALQALNEAKTPQS